MAIKRPILTVAQQRDELARKIVELVDAFNALSAPESPGLPDVGPGAGLYGDGSTYVESIELDDKGRTLAINTSSFSAGTPPVTFPGYKRIDPGGALSNTVRVHIAGMSAFGSAGGRFAGATTNTLQNIGAGQMAYAYPHNFEEAQTIVRLCTRTNGRVGTTGTPKVKMGVYANTTLSGHSYPGTRLLQSTDIDIDGGTANKFCDSAGLSLSISAGTRVWFVIVFNDQAVTNQYTVPAYRRGVLYPIAGFLFDPTTPSTLATDDATSGVGWRHAITYGTSDALPDPFPTSAPAVLVDTDLTLPCVGFGYQ